MLLDSCFVCVIRSCGKSEWGKIETFHFVPVNSSRLSDVVFVLEPFLRMLKVNQVLRGLTLLSATITDKHFAYPDDVSVLVTSTVDVSGGNREVGEFALGFVEW